MTTLADPQTGPRDAAIPANPARVRDIRLDFFRGLAMFTIMISHMPGNPWSNWLHGRWGFSDAAEIFVFCSGMASAIAFGRAFDTKGWTLGTARVSYRVWQVYWAHIGLFFVLATMLAAWDMAGLRGDLEPAIGTLNLWKFFEDPAPQLVGLFTLTYVPNFFDILPMYLVILALMPAMMLAYRASPWLALGLALTLWLLAQRRILEAAGLGGLYVSFPAEPWSDREWFFNPMAWQLCFFTGFALMRGWLPRPPVTPLLMGLALAVLLASMIVSGVGMRTVGWDDAMEWRTDNLWAITKTDLGIVRYTHFLALAYVAWVLAGEGGKNLLTEGRSAAARAWDGARAQIMKVGQQSLAVFVVSMIVSRLAGLTLDIVDRTALTVALANIGGIALLIATAHLVAWYKSQPWRKTS